MENAKSPLTQASLEAFHSGEMQDAYRYFGAHTAGNHTSFTVWIPAVKHVAVACTNPISLAETVYQLEKHPLDETVWQVDVPLKLTGYAYEYVIETSTGATIRKADPYARASELRPKTKSIVAEAPTHTWSQAVLQQKKIQNDHHNEKPMAIYELHIGTWKRNAQGDFLTYRELVEELIPYVLEMGFTHIEILPITEHPLDESWGYQATGYFSPTSRYGTSDDLKYFVAQCALHKIGLILDWIPGHFCVDEHALACFNGRFLYEYDQEERRENPEWGTLNFDIRRGEVVSFLLSSSHYWMQEFKFDGFRMDALISLLFIPNSEERQYNPQGTWFLQELTKRLTASFPGVLLIAEDAWNFPKVTHDIAEGGIGFHYKWNFGWMRDTLDYMETPPAKRSEMHGKMNFSLVYQYDERFLLALSHDEVVHGEGSLLNKLPGTLEERFSQLRLLLGYWIAHPGKKLLFMGQEFGHFEEWNFKPSLDWASLKTKTHNQMADFTKKLLAFYKTEKAFFELDDQMEGFSWIDADNHEQSVAAFIRRGHLPQDQRIVICNFSEHHYQTFQIGVPEKGTYDQIFTTCNEYGEQAVTAMDEESDKLPCSIVIDLPAFTMSIWKRREEVERNEQ